MGKGANPEIIGDKFFGAMVARDTIVDYYLASNESADLMIRATQIALTGSTGQVAAEAIILRYTSNPGDPRLKGIPKQLSTYGTRAAVVKNLKMYLSWPQKLRSQAAVWMTQDSIDR